METFWFTAISGMLAVYVVLDGFDFGAGILHLFVAKSDSERRTVLAAIGPFWDGNEVWLIASGGSLLFIFPRAFSAGFSGFYLPATMLLWLLLLRGISIVFRSLEDNDLWHSFWDGVFFFSSALMAFVLGVALGNIIRGVPLNASGFFSGPLFTNFLLGKNPGLLDWYTALVGLFAVGTLALHGALFLRMKTNGAVKERSTDLAKKLYLGVVALGALVTFATISVQPKLFANVAGRPLAWLLAAGVFASVAAIPWLLKSSHDGAPFFASCGLIASLLAATATALYPTLLLSTIDASNDLNIGNSAAGPLSLQVGIYWWIAAMVLTVAYFAYLFLTFGGKVDLTADTGH